MTGAEPTGTAPADAPIDLKLDALRKSYGDTIAVHEVSLEAARGEFISLLGPSGCGKTTTLTMIAGFQDLSSGSVWVRGRRVDQLPPEKRNTGMVFQNYALFPHMSVADNVAFGLKMRSVPRDEVRHRVAHALAQIRMADYADRRPSQLSGGQQQRVALARALVIEPHVLLLDEPFGALDRQLRDQMQVELKSLQRSVGITTVFVTHDQDEALSMSDRVVVMNQGRIEQLDRPDAIYERPATTFVARFIGGSNFVPGRIAGIDAGTASVETSLGIIRATVNDGTLRTGDSVQCMVRPERVRVLAPDAAPADHNVCRGRLRQVGYHGATTVLHVDMEQGIPFIARVQATDLAAMQAVNPWRQDVELAWRASDTLIYADERLRN